MPKLRTIVANLTASMKSDRLGSQAMPLVRWKKAPASGVGGKLGPLGVDVPWGGTKSSKPKNAIGDIVPRYTAPRCYGVLGHRVTSTIEPTRQQSQFRLGRLPAVIEAPGRAPRLKCDPCKS